MIAPPKGTKQPRPDVNLFAEKDSTEFGPLLVGKLQSYQTGFGTAQALHDMNVSTAYSHLYGLDVEGVGANAAFVSRSGEQGSIAELRIPAAAGQLSKVFNLVVGPELSWSTVAVNTDFANEAKAITAKNALHYYWSDKDAGAVAKQACFEALAFGEAAVHIPWDESKGEDAAIDGNRIVKSGDIDYRLVSTWNLYRDPTAKSWDSLRWVVVCEYRNRFDVAAEAPNEDVKQAAIRGSSVETSNATRLGGRWRPWTSTSIQSDEIPVFYLYHKVTPSVPQGRQTVFLENGEVLSDAPLDKAYHKHLPVVRISAGEYSGTPYPYTKFAAVLGAQQATDTLFRDLVTDATAISGSVYSIEDDDPLAVPQMGGGPKVIRRPKGTSAPVLVNQKQLSSDHFNLISRLQGNSQQILGLDNLTAGQEIGANLSGAAMALLTSTSVQNNSQLQASWAKFVQTIGTVTLAHIQYHMPVPRKVILAGKSRASLVKATELSGAAVSGIDRVQVELGSALEQTAAGRLEIVQTMQKNGWVLTPQQIQTVLDTGRLDAMTEGLSNELLTITEENEGLSEGKQVPVRLTDDHALHLKLHKQVTASLAARNDPAVLQAVIAHENEHIQMLRETDPVVLQALGQQPLAPPQQQGGAPAGQPPPPPQAPQQVAQQQAPSMPTNPMDKIPQNKQPQGATTPPALQRQPGPVAGTMPPSLAIRNKQ